MVRYRYSHHFHSPLSCMEWPKVPRSTVTLEWSFRQLLIQMEVVASDVRKRQEEDNLESSQQRGRLRTRANLVLQEWEGLHDKDKRRSCSQFYRLFWSMVHILEKDKVLEQGRLNKLRSLELEVSLLYLLSKCRIHLFQFWKRYYSSPICKRKEACQAKPSLYRCLLSFLVRLSLKDLLYH